MATGDPLYSLEIFVDSTGQAVGNFGFFRGVKIAAYRNIFLRVRRRVELLVGSNPSLIVGAATF